MKVAIIDEPLTCAQCPFCDRGYCNYSDKWFDDYEDCHHKKVADWCELVDVPEKYCLSDEIEVTPTDMWVMGWNKCIDIIWGRK